MTGTAQTAILGHKIKERTKMAAPNRLKMTVDAVLKVRDLYAETVTRGSPGFEWKQRRYSHAQIAKMMDCSEGTVFRIVNRLGAYSWVGGESVGEVKLDPKKDKELQEASAASLARLNALLAGEGAPVEDAPDPDAQLTPEMEAKVAAIKEKLKLGNS